MKETLLRCCAAIVALVHAWASTLIIPTWDLKYFATLIVTAGFTTMYATFALLGSKAAERVFHRIIGQTMRQRKAHAPLRNDE